MVVHRACYMKRIAVLLTLIFIRCHAFCPPSSQQRQAVGSLSAVTPEPTSSLPPELERTAQHLQKLQKTTLENNDTESLDVLGKERERIYREYLLYPANALKNDLKDRGLVNKGRKPDLARRLAQDDLDRLYGKQSQQRNDNDNEKTMSSLEGSPTLNAFAGFPIGPEVSRVVSLFPQPTSIQEAAMAHFLSKPTADASCILHAATGSGKTIAYLLPLVETLRRDLRGDSVYFILTPTRELAGQVASVAERLVPSSSLVQHVSHPSNLSSYKGARIFVGSAKCIYQSLYGKKKNDAPPTPKPLAMQLLTDTSFVVVDEVDRLLHRPTQKHEKPAAILIAAVARLSLGRACLIAASATAGRPVRRELARCLGLPPTNSPPVIRGTTVEDVTIPDTITHYSVPVPADASPGLVLTTAVGKVVRSMDSGNKGILMVLARSFGLTTQHTVGALQHFGVPASLESTNDGNDSTTVLVTTEDSVRGMDWNVDHVVLLGRPTSVSEYKHICGRTGRAGRKGTVVTVGESLKPWETMLGIEFQEWTGQPSS